jgi:hypothetical protein
MIWPDLCDLHDRRTLPDPSPGFTTAKAISNSSTSARYSHLGYDAECRS